MSGTYYFTASGSSAQNYSMVAMSEGDTIEDQDEDGVSVDVDSLVQQAQQQQTLIRGQQQMTSDVLVEVNELRDTLIKSRFQKLDKLAKRLGWNKNRRIPKSGNRHWDEYQEWKFLKDNPQIIKSVDPQEPAPAPKPVKKVSQARPLGASKRDYKPDWLLE